MTFRHRHWWFVPLVVTLVVVLSSLHSQLYSPSSSWATAETVKMQFVPSVRMLNLPPGLISLPLCFQRTLLVALLRLQESVMVLSSTADTGCNGTTNFKGASAGHRWGKKLITFCLRSVRFIISISAIISNTIYFENSRCMSINWIEKK